MSKRKGTRGEKLVVEWFEQNGWYAQRTGGSGGGISDARPDVVALRRNANGRTDCVVTEIKSRSDGTVRFENDEIKQVRTVSAKSGALGLFIVRPDLRLSEHPHMYAFTVDELKENNKSRSVTKSMLPGPTIAEKIKAHFI
jgi:Holliday junction resolvase